MYVHSLHTSFLLNTEIMWLSRGKSLTRLFEMRAEVRTFLTDNDFALGDRLCNECRLTELAYCSES